VVSENVNMAVLLEEIKNSFEFLAAEAKVDFKIEADRGITLDVDVRRLKVVLSNIIYNAIKYSDTNKERRYVNISVNSEQDCVAIKIRDNGIGIHEAHIGKIFEMFFRATELSEGSGLGLYIVKETLDRLHGVVTCESEEYVGTSFVVKVPHDPKDRCIANPPIAV
jgi:signal transduction histidine kinase